MMGEAIVVVGAGVSGLTTALLLSRNKQSSVTVVAKHMPGDYDIEYASPFAGANVVPMSEKENSHWEIRTWKELKRLCETTPEAGIHFQKSQLHRRTKDFGAGRFPDAILDPNPWFKDHFPEFRNLPVVDGSSDEGVLPGHDSACEYTSVCINTAIYLPWLVGQLLKNGVVLRRAVLTHILDAKTLSHTGKKADIIINATGLGSLKLGGVLDTTMAPARGQVVLVRNEASPANVMVISSGTDDSPKEVMYVMQRAAGGGTVLGGTYDLGNWESQPDPDVALRIMARAVAARPQMAGGKGVKGLSVIRHGVGLRPYRKGGVRIEGERVLAEDGDGKEEKEGEGTWVVHNYGHAGWGYQGSYGCAEDVVKLVEEIRDGRAGRAKL